ncbi:MAG: hypothetical protein CM15mP84_05780 [Cellvibrionales bacterium]|nr:MAG: hypothetical protein CM15mP84_05780 [Cellvibrionales bacterium]
MDDVEQSLIPAVGVVIDGLPIGTATGSLMSLWDVEQVKCCGVRKGNFLAKTLSEVC